MLRFFQLVPAALFFFSGCASLIFETLCSRRLALVIGNTVQSASTTVSAFLFGLGMGAHLGGIIIRRSKNPLKTFALLETAAGLGALIVLALIPKLPLLLVPLAQNAPGLLPPVRIVLVFLLLLLPASAMGASLPVLSHYYVENLQSRFVASLGFLYAINTLGAACGVLATDFFLVQRIGVTRSGWVSCALYLTVAALALVLAKQGAQPMGSSQLDTSSKLLRKKGVWVGWVVLAASGFCGLSVQVLWTRMLAFFNGNDVFAFSTTLTVYLLGLVIGSAIIGVWGHLLKAGIERYLGWLLTALGLGAYLSLFSVGIVRQMRAVFEEVGIGMTLSNFLSCALVMLPATVCLGLLFPLAAEKIRESAGEAGRAVGQAYLLNTLGSVLGALSAGYVVLPLLGLQHSLALQAVIATCLGAIVLLRHAPRKFEALMGPLALGAVLFFTPADFLLKTFYEDKFGTIVFAVDDHYGSIALTREWDPTLQEVSENLLVDGFNMAGNTPTAKRYTTGLAALPILLQEHSENVLIVCMGLGNTLNTAVSLEQVKRVQAVELSRWIPEALLLTDTGPKVLASPKLHIEFGDGRNHLLNTEQKYDVISAEPPPPTHAGIVNLYSQEYYALCASRLNEGGTVAQWLPVFQLSTFETKTIIRAFQEEFPYSYLWELSGNQLCLLGRKQALDTDFQNLVERVEVNDQFLAETGWNDPSLIAALCIAGPEQLRQYTSGVPPLTDDWPRIQYSDGSFYIDREFLFFSARERDLDWKATPQQLEDIAKKRKAVLAHHLYSVRDGSLSDLERYDLAGFTMQIMPGDSYFETRYLVSEHRLLAARRVSEEQPSRADAHFEVARIEFINNNLEKAEEAASKAAALDSPRRDFYELFEMLVGFRQGREEEVSKRFHALSLPPTQDSEYLRRLLNR